MISPDSDVITASAPEYAQMAASYIRLKDKPGENGVHPESSILKGLIRPVVITRIRTHHK